MKLLVIYNPVSGSKVLRYSEDQVQKILNNYSVEFTWFETVDQERQPLEQFADKDFDRILVLGGDGTLRDTIQFLVDHNLKIPIAVIAQGSGNILVASLGIPFFPLKRALQFALEEEPKPLDVMMVNKNIAAVLAVGQGYDSLFVAQATRQLKRKIGPLAYVWSFFKTFFGYKEKKYTITIDGKKHVLYGKLAIVINALSVQGLHLDKEVSPCDGVLNVILMNPRSIWDFFYILTHYFVFKKKEHPRFTFFSGTEIEISQHGAKEIQIDGEVLDADSAHVSVLPSALSLVYAPKNTNIEHCES